MSFTKGVDVAFPYQGDAYDTTGLGFVFVKATEGAGYTNPHQSAQLNQGTKHGLVPGVYHFMSPGVPVKAQAQHFKDHAIVHAGTIIAVDWESHNGTWPTNAEKDALIKLLKGMYPKNKVGLYTNGDGWKHHDKDSYCGDFLWIASPGTAGSPAIKHDWLFHQYGIVHNVDQNVCKFATLHELKSWAGYQVSDPKATDVTAQSGHSVWVYKNPMGPNEEDAYARLVAAEKGIEEVQQVLSSMKATLDLIRHAVVVEVKPK